MIKTLEGLIALEVGTKVKDRLGDTWVRGIHDGTHPTYGDYEEDVLYWGDPTSGEIESLNDNPYMPNRLIEWYGPFEVVDNG